jgi:uncharacterized integral membrane protein (TIGR00698 family)
MLLDSPRRTDRAQSWLVPLAVAAAATAASVVMPLASPLLVSLAVGAVVANSPLQRRLDTPGTASAAKFMLRLGIVLLGLRLALGDIAEVGVVGIATVLVTVTLTFRLTQYVGRRMGLEHDLVDLVAAGFSICGAAAVAAVQDSIGAKQRNVALALALVTLFGTVMMLVVPALGLALGMGAEDRSLWVGASIHEVAQVVAATALVGGGSLAIAMSVKLGRVLMLVPVHHAVIRSNHATQTRRVGVPWFLWGFMAAVAVRSTGLLPDLALDAGQWGATLLLGAGMYGLGLGLAVRDLWPVPPKALLLATMATSVVTLVPLALITAF